MELITVWYHFIYSQKKSPLKRELLITDITCYYILNLLISLRNSSDI